MNTSAQHTNALGINMVRPNFLKATGAGVAGLGVLSARL